MRLLANENPAYTISTSKCYSQSKTRNELRDYEPGSCHLWIANSYKSNYRCRSVVAFPCPTQRRYLQNTKLAFLLMCHNKTHKQESASRY